MKRARTSAPRQSSAALTALGAVLFGLAWFMLRDEPDSDAIQAGESSAAAEREPDAAALAAVTVPPIDAPGADPDAALDTERRSVASDAPALELPAEARPTGASPTCTLVGRAVWLDGEPARHVALDLVHTGCRFGGPHFEQMFPLSTAADGTFRVELGPRPRVSWHEFELTGADAGVRCASEASRLPNFLPPGDYSLDDVVLVRERLLATGRVLDTTGRPISAASVAIERVEDAPLPERSGAAIARTVAGPSGDFELTGDIAGDTFDLVARAPGYAAKTVRALRAGGADLAIALAAGAELETDLLVDPGLPLDALLLVLTTSDGAELARIAYGPIATRWSELPEGLASLAVFGFESDPPLARVERIELQAGRAARDKRVQPLDLRGRAHRIRVEVVGDDGAPVSIGVVQPVAGRLDPRRPTYTRIEGGRAVIVAHGPEVDAELRAFGHVPSMVRGLSDGARVVLQRSP